MHKATMIYQAAYDKAVDMTVERILSGMANFDATKEKCVVRLNKKFQQWFRYNSEHTASFTVVAFMLSRVDFDEFPTNEVYDSYVRHCEVLKCQIIKKEHFTRFVCEYFGYIVVDKRLERLNGRKCRLFVKVGE